MNKLSIINKFNIITSLSASAFAIMGIHDHNEAMEKWNRQKNELQKVYHYGADGNISYVTYEHTFFDSDASRR